MSTAINSIPSVQPAAPVAKSGFIIGPLADTVLIIGAPIVGLIIAGPLFALPSSYFGVSIQARGLDVRQLLITIFIHAHLFLVYFRTHANPGIFRTYPLRFTAVPLGMFLIGALNPFILMMMGMVAVWWDVYHSSLQTFGFGRIYDAKQKNDAVVGRNLDYWMNLLVYVGPVLAGAHFVDHLNLTTVQSFRYLPTGGNKFSELFLQQTPDFLQKHQAYLAIAILSVGVPFAIYYLYSYYRLYQQGYQISWQKVWLMIITSSVSIYCWGFRSFIDAFWVMNFFHALQYFAIVIFSEKRNLAHLFRTDYFSSGWVLAAFWVVSFSLLYGLWASFAVDGGWALSLVVTTALMHFWYDGFVWSVKKKQV